MTLIGYVDLEDVQGVSPKGVATDLLCRIANRHSLTAYTVHCRNKRYTPFNRPLAHSNQAGSLQRHSVSTNRYQYPAGPGPGPGPAQPQPKLTTVP